MSDILPEVPKENDNDLAFKAIKGMLGLTPYAGSLIGEMFEILFGPSLESRKNKWLEQCRDMVVTIQKNTDFKRLQYDQEFISLFLKLTQAALKTHQDVKLAYFKKILINSVVQEDLSYDIKYVISSFVEENTVSHLLIMKYIYEFGNEIKSYDSFKAHYDFFCKKYTMMNITFPEFTYYCRSLEKQRMMDISNLLEDDSEAVISSGAWLTANNTNPDAPHIVLTKMGMLIIKYLEN